jgi:hypothetical protein
MNYQELEAELFVAKADLKQATQDFKAVFASDKFAVMQCINDYTDRLVKDLPASFDDAERRWFDGELSNYACTLHPKD